MVWRFFVTNIVPVLYVVGVFYAVVIQANRIRNLKDDLKRSRANLEDLEKKVNTSVFALEKASKAKEEVAEIELRNTVAALITKFESDRARADETAKTIIFDFTSLLTRLFAPLAETQYLEYTISQLPAGIVKDGVTKLHDGIRKVNKEQGIANPVLALFANQVSDRPKTE